MPPYSNFGSLAILLLTILFALTLLVSLLWIRKKAANEGQMAMGQIIAIMFLLYLLVNSLGFYIY